MTRGENCCILTETELLLPGCMHICMHISQMAATVCCQEMVLFFNLSIIDAQNFKALYDGLFQTLTYHTGNINITKKILYVMFGEKKCSISTSFQITFYLSMSLKSENKKKPPSLCSSFICSLLFVG